MKIERIILIIGLLLIVIGVYLTLYQFFAIVNTLGEIDPSQEFPSRAPQIDILGVTASVDTTYVGVVVIFYGVLLVGTSYLATMPWKQRETSLTLKNDGKEVTIIGGSEIDVALSAMNALRKKERITLRDGTKEVVIVGAEHLDMALDAMQAMGGDGGEGDS